MTMIKERLSLLRNEMKKAGVAACIVPGTDPHASEYIADCWKDRVWISGFNGSAGTVVVANESAGLWTDSRYFLQGETQLSGSGIDLMKMGMPETPDMIQWLITVLNKGEKVAVNSEMFSVNAYAAMKKTLNEAGLDLVSMDLISLIWEDRPTVPLNTFFVFDVKYAGKSLSEKLQALREEMKKKHSDVFIMSMLDEIVWLFNIRGNDVDYNPVVISYAVVEIDSVSIFVDERKLTDEVKTYFAKEGVNVLPYNEISDYLNKLSITNSVLYDGAKLNRFLYEAIPSQCNMNEALSPVSILKSIKNEVEIEGFKNAMKKDGAALVRFFKWLEENVNVEKLTELSVDEKLYEFRSQQDGFMGKSFNSIASYGAHGAIVHYSATPETDVQLKPDNIFLLDSGGQYMDGTTDITRTVTLGATTVQQKIDFTLVLKGHIALSTVIFPVRTRGSQVDILARKAMWDMGVNYGHGTGHGVGHFLNVHEGPQSIRMEENPIILAEGMVMSNEPGLYRTDQYGIRTENLIVVVPAMTTEFGTFLKFETITLCPIDQNLIDVELLTDDEITWINNYHKKVYDSLSEMLDEDEREWLSYKCTPIKR